MRHFKFNTILNLKKEKIINVFKNINVTGYPT